MDVEVTVGSKF